MTPQIPEYVLSLIDDFSECVQLFHYFHDSTEDDPASFATGAADEARNIQRVYEARGDTFSAPIWGRVAAHWDEEAKDYRADYKQPTT